MTDGKSLASDHQRPDRLPLQRLEDMTEMQRRVAADLTAGPRGGVMGPFIPLLRSPELLELLGKVGEYLRFRSAIGTRVNEFVVLIVSRHLTNQFEWAVHYPLALKAGLEAAKAEAVGAGRRPDGMSKVEAVAYDLSRELLGTNGLCEATFRSAIDCFGEQGVVELVTLIGYFTTVSWIMNVAHTPPAQSTHVRPLAEFPL